MQLSTWPLLQFLPDVPALISCPDFFVVVVVDGLLPGTCKAMYKGTSLSAFGSVAFEVLLRYLM